MSNPKVVCVLGMHRSGTSLVARILNILGVYLGLPERMMKPQTDNPRGFWEHQLLEELNDEILSRLGGSWHEPPVFLTGWDTAPALGDLRQRARGVIQQDFAGAELWGWKDPRTCLTLPFWQRLLPPMRYVICLRNPVDVARSLERRNGFSFEKSVNLWLTHVTSALAHTSGQERLFVFYEDTVRNWHRELRRLSTFLGATELSEQARIQTAVREFTAEELQHYRSSVVDTADEPRLTFPAKALYLLLRIYLGLREGGPQERGEIDAILHAPLDMFGRYSLNAQMDLAALEPLTATLREKEMELQSRIESEERLRIESEERLKQQLERERELQQLQEDADRFRRELEVLVHSRSWKLTAPARQLRSALGRFADRPRRGRRLNRLRELWYRAAWDCLPLRSLTPAALEAGPSYSPQEAIRWISPVQIGRHAKDTLFAHPPARVMYRFTVPPRATFRSLIALMPEVWDRNIGGVVFSISVCSRDSRRAVERRWRIRPIGVSRNRGWTECRVPLRRFANREAELTLSTSAAAGASADFASAIWGDPAILCRRRARDVWSLCRGFVKVHGLRGAVKRIGRAVASTAGSPVGATPRDALVAAPGSSAPPVSVRPLLEHAWGNRLKLFLSDPSAKLVFPSFPDPLVSILIPTFNKAEYLYQCLESILACTEVSFELVIVDDCSSDDTPRLLRRLENVRCVRNEENLEFIRACNTGAKLARGRYLLFLNNDVTVTPQWLSRLVTTMEGYPQCGAVQGRLIRPDGTVQEAGTIVWRDGSALGYGRGDDPFKPEYGYVREVDYCSAACLLVRAELFWRMGGFDERYRPAYYEDVDLCFGVRRLGYKVVLQPQVNVCHYEFGSRSFERARALCEANQSKFVKKWAAELAHQHPYGEVLRARDRREGKRVLVMDDQIPAPHLGSGLPRAYKMLELLCELGFITTFAPLTIRTQHQPATHRLQQLGVETFYGDVFSPEELLRDRAGYYDIVLVSRPHNAVKWCATVRQYFPKARIVYDAEALFCMRDFRKAEIEGRRLSEAEKESVLRRELDIMKEADVVLAVSEAERDIILEKGGHHNVVVCGHACEVRTSATPFSERKDLLFVGGFLHGHPPNTDAVLYLARTLFPRIRRKLPDCRLVVAGAQPPDSIRGLASEHIVVAGYVEDLTDLYEKCRAFVVPLRFGGGISLKLLEAMSQGIPAVVSAFGATGLSLEDGREALIARSDEEFVEKVVRLYEDERLWCTVQRVAQEYIGRHCSSEAMRKKLAEALGCAVEREQLSGEPASGSSRA